MTQVPVVETFGDLAGPLLELGGVDLHRGAAQATRQVVVVRIVDASPIEGLTPVGHDHVDLAGVGEFLQLAVDGRQGDLTPVTGDESVQVLGADESLDPFEGPDYLTALRSVSGGGHDASVVAACLLTGMIPANIFRMVLKYSRHRVRAAATLTVLALGSLALAGCGSPATAPGVLAVVGAEVQYGDVLGQIGGAYVQVTSVMSNPATDPHNFEASPSVARAIASARLVVQNGAGYDSFMNKLEGASAGSSRVVLSVATLLHRGSAANPHFWYAPATMPLLAATVTRELSILAPAHASYFRARESAFAASWRRVTATLAAAKRTLAHRAVATTEPVGDYLLSALGVTNLTPFRFQADVMNGVDPSPQDIVTQQNLLRERRVSALCFNAQVSSPVTLALRADAVRAHVPLVAIYETMPSGEHVQGWMIAEIDAIAAALEHGVSTTRLS